VQKEEGSMATLTRWDLARQLQEDAKALTSFFDRGVFGNSESFGWQPSVDIYEDVEGVTFKVDVPDVDPKDINVHIENGVLSVKGERRLENEQKRDNYHRLERSYGLFTRSFALPASYDFDKVTAETKNGVLRIFIPKRAEAKPRSIQVKVQ
jgi:HSP20 family protein